MDFMLLGSGLEVCAREERVEKGDELTHVVLTALSAKPPPVEQARREGHCIAAFRMRTLFGQP